MFRVINEESPGLSTRRLSPGILKEGDLVLKDNRAPIHDPRGKFRPNWTSPYIIKSIWSAGAVVLMDLDGLEFSQPINMDKLKKYFP
ncbi:hypothetical protein ACSBR2_021672 [Camellia fascicularis]